MDSEKILRMADNNEIQSYFKELYQIVQSFNKALIFEEGNTVAALAID